MTKSVIKPSLSTCCRSVIGTPVGWVRPRSADLRLLESLPCRPLPPVRTTVSTTVLRQRPRRVPAAGIIEGQLRPARVELALTSIVVEHPAARFLIDPAICREVRTRVIAAQPALLRPAVRPPRGIVPTVDALAELTESRLDFALATHAHWDHVSGLMDMPGLALTLHQAEYAWISAGEPAPAAGVRPALAGREIRTVGLDGPPVLAFASSHDLFGDGSVVLVDLAGHTPGSVGILLATERGRFLLAGDAAWHSHQVTRLRRKPSYPGLLVDHDPEETWRTLHRLHLADRVVTVVPSHDRHALRALA